MTTTKQPLVQVKEIEERQPINNASDPARQWEWPWAEHINRKEKSKERTKNLKTAAQNAPNFPIFPLLHLVALLFPPVYTRKKNAARTWSSEYP